eukprot:8609150-Ditylum_brightwellii.AAC.1
MCIRDSYWIDPPQVPAERDGPVPRRAEGPADGVDRDPLPRPAREVLRPVGLAQDLPRPGQHRA